MVNVDNKNSGAPQQEISTRRTSRNNIVENNGVSCEVATRIKLHGGPPNFINHHEYGSQTEIYNNLDLKFQESNANNKSENAQSVNNTDVLTYSALPEQHTSTRIVPISRKSSQVAPSSDPQGLCRIEGLHQNTSDLPFSNELRVMATDGEARKPRPPTTISFSYVDQMKTETSTESVEEVCRICHDNPSRMTLLAPCLCKGSMGKVHRVCLERWLGESAKTSCEICGHEYETERRPRYTGWRSIVAWIRNPLAPTDTRNLFFDLACFFILTPLACISAWLCVVGAKHYSFGQTVRYQFISVVAAIVSISCSAIFDNFCELIWKHTLNPDGTQELSSVHEEAHTIIRTNNDKKVRNKGAEASNSTWTSIGLLTLTGTLLGAYYVWLFVAVRYHIQVWREWQARNFVVRISPLNPERVRQLMQLREATILTETLEISHGEVAGGNCTVAESSNNNESSTSSSCNSGKKNYGNHCQIIFQQCENDHNFSTEKSDSGGSARKVSDVVETGEAPGPSSILSDRVMA